MEQLRQYVFPQFHFLQFDWRLGDCLRCMKFDELFNFLVKKTELKTLSFRRCLFPLAYFFFLLLVHFELRFAHPDIGSFNDDARTCFSLSLCTRFIGSKLSRINNNLSQLVRTWLPSNTTK